MDEKQKQAAGQDTARRAAAESHLRQALVGLAKARQQAHEPGLPKAGDGPCRSGRSS